MTIYNIELRKTDGQVLELGTTNTKAKMNTFKIMQSHGEEINNFLDFEEFVWNTKKKVWEFFTGNGDKIGFIAFDVNHQKQYEKKLKQYKENLAAYSASKR